MKNLIEQLEDVVTAFLWVVAFGGLGLVLFASVVYLFTGVWILK